MPEVAKRKWCRVIKRGPAVIIEVTPDNDRVVIARNYQRVRDAEVGDILSFVPSVARDQKTGFGKLSAKLFGNDPDIIGYSVLEASHAPAKAEATEQAVHSC